MALNPTTYSGGSTMPTSPAMTHPLDAGTQAALSNVENQPSIRLFSDEKSVYDQMKSDGLQDDEAIKLIKGIREKALGGTQGMTSTQYNSAHDTLSNMMSDGLSLKEAAQTINDYRAQLAKQPKPVLADQHADEWVVEQWAKALPRGVDDTAGQIWHWIGNATMNLIGGAFRGVNDLNAAVWSSDYSPELAQDIKDTTGSSGYLGDISGVTKNTTQAIFNIAKAPLAVGLNTAAEAPGTQYVMQWLGTALDKTFTGVGWAVGLDENTSRNIGQTGMNLLGMKWPWANTLEYAQNVKGAYSGLERPMWGGIIPAAIEAVKEPIGAVKDVAMMPYNMVKSADGALTGIGEKFAGVKWSVWDNLSGLDKATEKWAQSNPYLNEYWKTTEDTAKWNGGILDPKLEATKYTGDVSKQFQEKVTEARQALSEDWPVYEAIRQMPDRIDAQDPIQAYVSAIKKNWLEIQQDGTIVRPNGSDAKVINDADLAKINGLFQDLIADTKKGDGTLSVNNILNNRKNASEYAQYDQANTSNGRAVIKQMRASLDAVAKDKIKWLREIDQNYADKIESLNDLEEGMVYKGGDRKGQFKDNIDSIIKNITTDSNTALRERLQETMPDLAARMEAINMIPKLWTKYTNPSPIAKAAIKVTSGIAGWFGLGLWPLAGALVWYLVWDLVSNWMSKVQQAIMSKKLGELSDEWVQRLYDINKKIEDNIDLKSKDKEFIDKLKKDIDAEIARQKSDANMKQGKAKANNALGAPSGKPTSARVVDVSPWKATPKPDATTGKQWERPGTAKKSEAPKKQQPLWLPAPKPMPEWTARPRTDVVAESMQGSMRAKRPEFDSSKKNPLGKPKKSK